MKYIILSTYKNSELAKIIISNLTESGNECWYNIRDAKYPLNPSKHEPGNGDVVLMMLDEKTVQNEKFWSICNCFASENNIYRVRMIKIADVEVPKRYRSQVDVIDGNQNIEAILFQIKNPGEPVSQSLVHATNVSVHDVASQLASVPTQGQSSIISKCDNYMTQPSASISHADNEETNNDDFFKNQRCQGVSFGDLLNIKKEPSMTVKRALRYFYGDGVPKDNGRAVQLLRKAIEENENDSVAYYLLGAYFETLGQDAKLAKDYYNKAVELDFNPAIIRCATVSMSKDADNSEARKMLLKVRSSGDIEGSYGLGMLCEIEENYEDAFEYYSEAAEMGDARAQNALGCLYDEGKGVETDQKNSWQWFELAAQQGLIEAKTNIGARLITQDGDSLKRGEQYLREAAGAGNQLAIYLVNQIDEEIAKQRKLERRQEEKRHRQEDTKKFIKGLFNVLGEGASYAKKRIWDEI